MKTSILYSTVATGLLLGASDVMAGKHKPMRDSAMAGSYDPNVRIKCHKMYEGTLHIVGKDMMLDKNDMTINIKNNGHKTLEVAEGKDAMKPSRFIFEVCRGPGLTGMNTKEVYGQLRPAKTADQNDCVSASRNNIDGSEDRMDAGPNELQIESCANHENVHLQRQLFQAVYDNMGHNGQPSVQLTLVGAPNRVSSRGYKPDIMVMDDKEFGVKGAITARTSNSKGEVKKTLALYDVKMLQNGM